MADFFAENQPDTAAEASLPGFDIPKDFRLLSKEEYNERVLEKMDKITNLLENGLHLIDDGKFQLNKYITFK